MDKYQRALVEVARLTKSLKQQNEAISNALIESYKAAQSTWRKGWHGAPEEPVEWAELGGKNLWLHRAYKTERERIDAWVFDEYYVYHDGSVRDYLAENCLHAYRAHDLIQARKDIKKELGIAKRRVSFLANRLLAEVEK